MRQVLNALLPKGAAWNPAFGGGFDGLLDGLADSLETLRAFLGSLADVREPQRTFSLEDLEREYGVVTDTGLTEAVRRTYLHGIKYGAIGLGTAADVQARLRAAGFVDVFVYQNNPAIDPDGFPGVGIELLATGELEDHPLVLLPPILERDWPFVFFIGGVRTGHDPNFIDWNMEYSGTLYWPDGNSAIVTKTEQQRQSGLRSLDIKCDIGSITDQQISPRDDGALYSFYRMHEDTTDTGTRVVGKEDRNLLIDGAMNQTGVASWTGVSATLTKQSGSPYSGRFCLRVDASGSGGAGSARQSRIINGRSYSIRGQARSQDGTTAPVIKSPSGTVRWTGTASTDWQVVSASWTEAVGSGNFDLTMDTADGIVEFDNMDLIDTGFDPPGGTGSNLSNIYTALIDGIDFDNASNAYCELIDDCIQNGDFASATGWTTVTYWSIGSGVATFSHPGTGGDNLTQTGANTLAGVILPGGLYRVTFTISNFTGACTCQPRLGGTTGTSRAANGTFVEDIRAGTGNQFELIGNCSGGGGSYDVDNVSVELIDETFWHENLTIEGIVNIDAIDAVVRGIVANGISGTSQQLLYVYNGQLKYSCDIGGTTRVVTASTVLEIDRDYHFVVTREYDGSRTTITIYIDKKSDGTGNWTGAPDVTIYNKSLIGSQRTAGGWFNGQIADHVAIYAEAKDSAFVAAAYNDYQNALIAGPYAYQDLASKKTNWTMEGAAWANRYDPPDGDSLPVVLAKMSNNSWRVVFVGDPYSVDSTKQTFSKSIADEFSGVRLYLKNTKHGRVMYDDITIDGTAIERYDVPTELQDKFKRLILGAKPIHSWAGLLVDWVLYGAGSSAGTSTASGSGDVT